LSIVKSFATGYGDTYYIDHGSDNFSIIDCRITEDRQDIIDEIAARSRAKGITRLISTHPDDDHIRGLARLDDAIEILNFYVVENEATKPDDTVDFRRYCELRDSDKAFYVQRGCERRWMNRHDEERKSSGINILWPDITNEDFKNVLKSAEDGGSPNNLSTIIEYSLNNGVTMLWFGDLETDFMRTIEDEISLPTVDILFAAHHGRARMPSTWMNQMDPGVVVLGEAPPEHLEYYDGRDHLRQIKTGDLIFECESGWTHIYIGERGVSEPFLEDLGRADAHGAYYLGSLPSGD
jgi:beta-lactamase superfamily II metal-dependent hydrolase